MRGKAAVVLFLFLLTLGDKSAVTVDTKDDFQALPDYVITQAPFLSYANMKEGERRSQVFSIWNREEKKMVYFLHMVSVPDITLEINKRGDIFYQGQPPEAPLELAELAAGEHVVMELTVKKEGRESGDIYPVFTKKENLSCDEK